MVMNKGNVLRVMDKNEPVQMKCWIKLIIFKVELMGKVNKGRGADKGGHKDSRKKLLLKYEFLLYTGVKMESPQMNRAIQSEIDIV